jgi:hypothetical protein
MFEQPLAEINQRRGMKCPVAQLTVQSEIPTRMIAQHFYRLPIRNGFQMLPQAYSQQQDGLNGNAPVSGTIANLQLGSSCGDNRINLEGKEPVAVGLGEELAGECGGGE